MSDETPDLDLRRSHKLYLLQNPNYFGNLTGLDLPDLPDPVLKKVGDTSYEELSCLGYNPDTRILTAMVEIKLGSGYSGGPCTDGSLEHVRFYLDYGDGVWVDHGAASFAAHDLGFRNDLCYAVSIRIDPKLTRCCDAKPVLPRVRGILSWNVQPPPGMPDWLPVWGNRLERFVQIDPRSPFLCRFVDIFDVGTVKVDPGLLAKIKAIVAEQPPLPKPGLSAQAQLTSKTAGIDSEEARKDPLLILRHIYPAIAKLAADQSDLASFAALAPLKALKIDLSMFDDFLLQPKFNTSYEELHCVGLDRDLSRLHGVVQIKRPVGFSGGLCTAGSREYIAFYLDFGAGWEYQGTTSVEVHDITPMPRGGLWYQAALPVNLDKHRRKWCETGRARIRGILSWSAPPPPNQPDFVPHWGDRQDCWIEVRPLPRGVPEGVMTPFLEAIGNMPVDQINAAGFANGPSIGGTFGADDSPFGGAILFAGLIAFPISSNLEYRVMVQGPSDVTPKPWTKSFDVTLTTVIGSSITVTTPTQSAPADWFAYLPRQGPVVFRSVAGNLLAVFSAVENGLHSVFLQVREQGTTTILATSATETFYVDNTAPVVDVEITSGGGNCSKFPVGSVLVGTYAMADAHSHSLSLDVTPHPESDPGNLIITSAVPPGLLLGLPKFGPGATNSLSYAALTLDTSGASGNWELDTTGMKPCGYNIRIHGVDRTIVNSGGIGWHAGDIEGFCLE